MAGLSGDPLRDQSGLMLAYRNRMDDDPVVFAVKDSKSYLMAAIIGAILFFAR